MRKITSEAIKAFNNFQSFNKQNMQILVGDSGDAVLMQLHGHTIAAKNGNTLSITNAGYNTRTTNDRLNALDGVHVYNKNKQLFLNDEKWDGEWIEIK
jgi:hypothetical protein